MLELSFERERETKNTVRFEEQVTDAPPRHQLGALLHARRRGARHQPGGHHVGDRDLVRRPLGGNHAPQHVALGEDAAHLA